MSKLHRDNAGYVGCSAEETQDPYYSYNKLALPLSGDINSVLREEVTFTVTVASAGGGNKYFIDGVQQATVTLLQGYVYTFDQSDSSNGNHPLRFSYTADGIHGGGTEITLGVTKNGTPGQSGAYTRIVVPFGMHDLKYYCAHHSGMGGAANVSSNPNMTTFGLPILKTTDAFGKTLGSGNNADPYATNLVLAIPMNGANNGTTFTDVSNVIRGTGSAKSVTVIGDPKTSTAQSNFYGSSAFFDGSGDRLSVPNSSDFDFLTDDFTNEVWIYQTEQTTNQWYLINAKYESSTYSWWWAVLGDYQTCYLYSPSQTIILSNSAKKIPINTWTHVAVSVKGGQAKLFQNGQLIDTKDFKSGMATTTIPVTYGEDNDGNYDFKGYMSDARIYKGVEKYSTPFPTGEYGFKAATYTGNNGTQQIGGPVFSSGLSASQFNSGYEATKAFDGDNTGTRALTPNNGHIAWSGTINDVNTIEFYRFGGNTDTTISVNGETAVNFPNASWTTVSFTGTTVNAFRIEATNNQNAVLSGVRVNGTVLIDGDGSTISFSPDLIWTKGRNQPSNHALYDTVRGPSKRLRANEIDAEDTRSGVTSFDANGWTEGNFDNQSGYTYVGWAWNAGKNSNKTYTVKVVSDGGNKYRFDDFGTSAVTLELAEGSTYVFDQSDSSNSGHPLRFSTTSDGTHGGGSEYTTGVTTTGTPGSAGAKTTIVVAASAPTLAYYCTQHSGMGGNVNTNSTAGASNFDGSTQAVVKADQAKGFSIVKWSGTNSGTTLGHGLGATPGWVIVKSLGNAREWLVWHSSFGTASNTDYLYLDTTGTKGGSGAGGYWNATAPTTTTFSVGDSAAVNGSGSDYIAYLWSEVPGFSKFGSYTGSGATGHKITTGFKPAWILFKRTDSASNWRIVDKLRGTASLNAETAEDEQTLNFAINDDGFTINETGNNPNAPGGNYIYMAFAESSATDNLYEAAGIVDVNTTDLSSSAHAITNSGATFQTAVSKFYDGSTHFSGGKLITPAGNDFQMGSGEWTMEFWLNDQTNASSYNYTNGPIIVRGGGNATYDPIFGRIGGSSAEYYYFLTTSDGSWNTLNANTGAIQKKNLWSHYVIQRKGDKLQTFQDGVIASNFTVTGSIYQSENKLQIGGGGDFYIQDFKWYKGIAKYTAPFSPPERSVEGTARRYPSGVYVVS